MSSYEASRLPSYAGVSGWNAVLPERPVGDKLDHTATADIVIIGAGFAGLSAARRLLLSDPTLDIVIVEAGALAQGSAGRNSGFMIDIPHDLASDDYAGQSVDKDREQLDMNRSAISFAREAAETHEFGTAGIKHGSTKLVRFSCFAGKTYRRAVHVQLFPVLVDTLTGIVIGSQVMRDIDHEPGVSAG